MSLPERPRAVITGAGSGLGRALCVALARRRARIVVSDVNEEAARETARRVEQEGGEARGVHCDVTSPEQVEALARESEAAFGGVDLVVNNAGVVRWRARVCARSSVMRSTWCRWRMAGGPGG